MTWNQNPPPVGAYDAVLNALGNVKPKQENRDPFLLDGQHSLIVISIEMFNHSDHGPSVRATFEYEKSTNPNARAGEIGVKLFNLFKRPKFPTQTSDADDFVDMVCKLQGVQLGAHHDAVRALIKTQAEGGQLELQPARGARINAAGRAGKPSPKTGIPYVTISWIAVPQDMALIARTRAELDQRRPIGMSMGAPVAPPAAQQYQPAPMMPVAPPPGGVVLQAVQPSTTQTVPAKPPWNPAWGPIPPGY